jgi:hypothetical protein
MEEYLSEYGYNFNEKLYLFAVSLMRDRSGNKVQPWEKEKVEAFLKNHGVNIESVGYNAAYVLCMARADYYGSSIADEQHLALFVKDYLGDIDGSKSRAFDEFYIKCVALGTPIFWDEVL